MAMTSANFTVGDLFRAVRGKSILTRDYALKHPGEYAVYSAALGGPLAFIDFHDYEGTYLSFTTNGYAGTTQILTGRFSVNADRALLVPREGIQTPDLRFLQHVIESALRPLAIGRRVEGKRNEYTKLSPDHAEAAFVTLPVTRKGDLDYDVMRHIGERLRRIDELRANLTARLADISAASVLIECEPPFEVVTLGDETLFRLSIGKRVLRSQVVSAGVPVFSANVRKPFGYLADADVDVSRDSLIWGIDGIFDWSLMPKGMDFVATDHCGRVEVLTNEIDPRYILHELRATKDKYGFDRVYRASLANIREVSARIPVRQDGSFDTERQRQLAVRYESVEQMRDAVATTLTTIVEAAVTPSLD